MKKIVILLFTWCVSIVSLMAQSCPDTLRATATVTITKHAPLPANMLPGKFTINSNGDQVSFSSGNLQYLAKQNEWRFAENQWTYIGNAVGNTLAGDANRETNVDWIDLFGWATSGNPDATSDGGNYEPWRSETTSAKYGASVTGSGEVWNPEKCDWGVVNMPGSGWRVLSQAEWNYLLNSRPGASQLKGFVQLRDANNSLIAYGLLLLPDGWQQINSPMAGQFKATSIKGYPIINPKSWEALEKEGAVFLTVGGSRSSSTISGYQPQSTPSYMYGYYWTSTSVSSTNAYVLYFNTGTGSYDYPTIYINSHMRYYGCSVRLVHDR